MFLIEVVVEAAKLLPLDYGECGVQRVQFRDLDIARVLVVAIVIRKSYPLACRLPVLCCTGRHPENAAERTILLVDSHAHIDKWDTELFQLSNDHSFVQTLVNADENEIHPAQFFHVLRGQKSLVNDNATVHFFINAPQIRYLRRL